MAKGETIEELALNMHVYTAALKDTYEKYCGAVAEGTDAEFGKAAPFLKAIDKAPFYAVKVYPTTFGSSGGVTTTEDGRVTVTSTTRIMSSPRPWACIRPWAAARAAPRRRTRSQSNSFPVGHSGGRRRKPAPLTVGGLRGICRP